MEIAHELNVASSLLVDRRPDLAAEWSETNTLELREVTWQSNRRVDWVCADGHRWTQSVQSRINRSDGSARPCPTCRVERRCLAKVFPEVAAQWHADNGRSAYEVSCSSRYEALWVCEQGHQWTATVNTRTSMRTGCPYCADNGRALAGLNDLASRFPLIAQEWDTEKNEFAPAAVRAGSDKPAWWICAVGHSYEMPVGLRTRRGQACPYCAGRRVLVGFNDLATLRSGLADEWSERNDFAPTDVTLFSCRSVEWLCAKGHRWTCTVASRTSRQPATQCPHCWHGRCSVVETMFWDALRDDYGFAHLLTGERTPVQWGRARFSEVDAMLRDQRVVIEYDGWYWHKDLRKFELDLKKTRALLAAEWSVIRIREHPLAPRISSTTGIPRSLSSPRIIRRPMSTSLSLNSPCY